MNNELLSKAIRIASVEFEGVFDKGGAPYILHCLWVMNKVRHLGYDYMIVAVLHDLIEDTDWNEEDLLNEGFPPHIVNAIISVTKDDKLTYMENIQRACINSIGCQVKLRDLEHNTKVTRLKGLEQKDFDRLAKYSKAYNYLKPFKR